MLIPGDTIKRLFTTRGFDDGIKVNADSLPTGTVYKNGVGTNIFVTVANMETGLYRATVTMTAGDGVNQFTAGDNYAIEIDATVDSVADQFIIAQGTLDGLRNSDLENVTQGNVLTACDDALNNYDAAVAGAIEGQCDDALSNYGAATGANVANAHSATDGKVDAVQSTVGNISNVTRLSTSLVSYMERGDANRAVKVQVALKDMDGSMEDPDSSVVALKIENAAGTSRAANLYKEQALTNALDGGSGAFTGWKELERDSEGVYEFYYKVEPAATEEELIFKYGWEEGGKLLVEFGRSQVTDSANDLLAIKAKTDQLAFSGGDVKATLDGEKVQVGGIDADAISAAAVAAAAVVKIQAGLSTAAALAIVDGVVDAIKAKTDNLPASPAAVGSKMDLTEDVATNAGKLLAKDVGDKDIAKDGDIRELTHKKIGDPGTEGLVEEVEADGTTTVTGP